MEHDSSCDVSTEFEITEGMVEAALSELRDYLQPSTETSYRQIGRDALCAAQRNRCKVRIEDGQAGVIWISLTEDRLERASQALLERLRELEDQRLGIYWAREGLMAALSELIP